MAEMIDYGPQAGIPGLYRQENILSAYVDHLMGYIDFSNLTPKKLVVNAGNGAAGHVINAIEKVFISQRVPVQLIKIHNEPDGTFPHGIPNPLLPENRADTANAVHAYGADMGIAWDGDSIVVSCLINTVNSSKVLHRRSAGGKFSAEETRCPHYLRPAPDLEHRRDRHPNRWCTGDVENRPCLYQRTHARRRCGVWRRDERAPLFP
jgi:Phosphomannomutase